MRLHRPAVLVFGEVGSTVLAWHRNEFAGRATDTNRNNLHAIFRGGLRGGDCLAAEIFAVRDENENLVGCGARFEDHFSLVNGRGDISPAARDNIDIQRVKRFAERVVVQRDWTLQKRTAGERNQTDAIAVEFRDEVSDGELRTREPVRLHILRQHAFRSVDRKEEFESFPMCLLKFEADLWSCESDEYKCDAEREEDTFRELTRSRNRRHEFRQETRAGELRERNALPLIKTAKLPHERGARGKAGKEPNWLGELHKFCQGRRRKRVCERPKLVPRTPSAGTIAHANSSV